MKITFQSFQILKLFSRKQSSDILRRSQKFGQSSTYNLTTYLVMSNKEWKMGQTFESFSGYLNVIIVTSVNVLFSIFFIQKICVQKKLKAYDHSLVSESGENECLLICLSILCLGQAGISPSE